MSVPVFVVVIAFAIALTSNTATVAKVLERTIAVSKSGCVRAAQYASGQEAAYQPGVNRQGKAVVPADVQDGRRELIGESISIIISSDLEERFGIPHDSPLLEAEAIVGIVNVRLSDGRLTFNGAPLTSQEAYALSELCRTAQSPR